jgi:DNA-binding MarR family transcriptional regulator
VADKAGLPSADQVTQVLGYVPQIEAYFRRAPAEMPQALAAVFAEHRLTARHGAVLAQLAPSPPISVTELAGRMGVSLSTASELVGDLSRAEIAVRRDDPDNRRRTLVSLSEEWRDVVQGFVALRAAPLLAVLDELSPRDLDGFARGLAAWAREVRHW